MRGAQGRALLLLGGAGPVQGQVVGDGPGEQVRVLRHPGDLPPPAVRLQFGQVVGPPVGGGDPDRPGGGRGEAQQDAEQGGLAGSGGPGEGDRLAGAQGERGAVQGGRAPAGEGHHEALGGEGGPGQGGRGDGAARRQRGLQHLEDPVGGGEALDAGVVERADLADREVDLGGEDQDQQPGLQVEGAVDQPEADGDGDQCDREGGEQFQREGGDEGDPQGAQGGPAVVGGDPGDGGGLGAGPVEDLERGQSGDHVQEVVREPGEPLPLTVHPGLGGHPDQHHEQRDQRQGAGDDRGRGDVGADDPQQHRGRDDHGERQLRQVAGEVVVERVDAPGGQGGELAGAPARQVGRAERGGVVEQPAPQGGLHPGDGPVRDQFGEPADQPPTDRGERQQRQRGAEAAEPGPLLEAADHEFGDQARLGHHQGRVRRPQQDGSGEEDPGGAGVAEESGVDRLHGLSPGRARRPGRARGCAGRRSACGTPSTSSSGRAAPAG